MCDRYVWTHLGADALRCVLTAAIGGAWRTGVGADHHPVGIHFPIRLSQIRIIVGVSCRLQSMYQPVESRREREEPFMRTAPFFRLPLVPDFHTFGWKKVQGDFLCLLVGKGICPIDLCNHETRRPGDERYGGTGTKAVDRLRDMMRTEGIHTSFYWRTITFTLCEVTFLIIRVKDKWRGTDLCVVRLCLMNERQGLRVEILDRILSEWDYEKYGLRDEYIF